MNEKDKYIEARDNSIAKLYLDTYSGAYPFTFR